MITTLDKIRAHGPCRDGWHALMNHLGKTKADDEPLSLEAVLDSNGLFDALWCLHAVDGHDRELRLYAVWCARQVQHLMPGPDSIAALDVAERYARGQASAEELSQAARAVEAAWAAAAKAEEWEVAGGRAMAASWAARAAVASWAARAAWAAARAAALAALAAWAADTAEWTVTTVKSAQEAEFRRICREIEAGRDPYPEEDGR